MRVPPPRGASAPEAALAEAPRAASSPVRDLIEQYALAFKEYCSEGGEAPLRRAYQLGRRAVGAGLGVLEMATVHQEALVAAHLERLALGESSRLAQRGSEFLAETLAPFEMTSQGLEDVSAILSGLNAVLERRLRATLRDLATTQSELLERKRSERLKTEFICMINHELRTPLTSIHGSLDLLQIVAGEGLNERALHLVDIAYRNSERLVRLVDDILELQKFEAGTMTFRMRPLEVLPFLQQAVEANQSYAAARGVSFRVTDVPAGLWIRADAGRLMQVMANLLSNAAKFSPPSACVGVAASREGGCARVSVTDHGPGVPRRFRRRIFQRFARAAASTDKTGSGLGLSICRAILDNMQGRIDFVSEPGRTTFYFDLPEWHPLPAETPAVRPAHP
jgi:signal transduction histidine kinase